MTRTQALRMARALLKLQVANERREAARREATEDAPERKSP